MYPVVADSGELTVLRTLAAFVYGSWSVDWPDSVPEDQLPTLPDGQEFGFIYHPDVSVGRMGRRFVRGDVKITAAEYTPEGTVVPLSGESDVERVLDEADGRTDGDVFFERSVGREGLGDLVPGVDFRVGDVWPVLVWGKTISALVSQIEQVSSVGASVDYRVSFGGSLLGDSSELTRSNREIVRVIAQERRERAGDVAEARSMAISAQSTADTARSEAKELRDTLGGAGASPESLLSQLSAINAQIVGMGGDAQPGLLSMYLAMNTRLWEFQQQWNREREEIDKRQDAQAELLQSAFNEARAASQNAQAAMARDMTRMLFADREQQVWDTFLQVKMPRFNRTVVVEQRGSWSGTVMLQLQYTNGAFYQRGKTLSGGQVWTENIPLGDVTNAIVFYQVQTGTGYGVGESDN